jgi:hypothetical protein
LDWDQSRSFSLGWVWHSAAISEESYTAIAKLIFELGGNLPLGSFDKHWIIRDAQFVSGEAVEQETWNDSYEVLRATGRQRLLRIAAEVHNAQVQAWVVQEADILEL